MLMKISQTLEIVLLLSDWIDDFEKVDGFNLRVEKIMMN